MPRAVEAVIDPDGRVRLLEDVTLQEPHRAIVTILDAAETHAETLVSEISLATDWNRPEEEEAWQHLQPDA